MILIFFFQFLSPTIATLLGKMTQTKVLKASTEEIDAQAGLIPFHVIKNSGPSNPSKRPQGGKIGNLPVNHSLPTYFLCIWSVRNKIEKKKHGVRSPQCLALENDVRNDIFWVRHTSSLSSRWWTSSNSMPMGDLIEHLRFWVWFEFIFHQSGWFKKVNWLVPNFWVMRLYPIPADIKHILRKHGKK